MRSIIRIAVVAILATTGIVAAPALHRPPLALACYVNNSYINGPDSNGVTAELYYDPCTQMVMGQTVLSSSSLITKPWVTLWDDYNGHNQVEFAQGSYQDTIIHTAWHQVTCGHSYHTESQLYAYNMGPTTPINTNNYSFC